MAREVPLSDVQDLVSRHNTLAEKYSQQIDILRWEAESAADVWQILLSQLFLRSAMEHDQNVQLPDETMRAAMDFGFQCIGVGAVIALDALAQERIVI